MNKRPLYASAEKLHAAAAARKRDMQRAKARAEIARAKESLRLTRDELREAHANGPEPCQVCGLPVYRFGGMYFGWSGELHNFACTGYPGNTTAALHTVLDGQSVEGGRRCSV